MTERKPPSGLMTKKRMTNKEFIEDRRQALRESIDYFSAFNKPERERWVTLELLKNLNIKHEYEEIKLSPQDPPDVLFRDCNFEIKEILDPGRKRHDEYKQKHEKALLAKHPRDLLEDYSPIQFTPVQIGELVIQAIPKYQRRYPSHTTQSLDLLFYVNYISHLQTPGPAPDSKLFQAFGWRSISVLEGWTSMVIFANDTAPDILRTRVGVVYRREF
jgi:hypothetical protein